jgi:hypothetical protein
MANTNFIEHNPTATNQENDATYQGDSSRTGGFTIGPFTPQLANKMLRQPTMFVAALALALQNKGYSTTDGSTPFTASGSPSAAVTALAAVLANILTGADSLIAASSFGANTGYVKFGAAFGGLIIQWGLLTGIASGSIHNFPVPFVNHEPAITVTASTNPAGSVATNISTVLVSFAITYTGTPPADFFWFAIGN